MVEGDLGVVEVDRSEVCNIDDRADTMAADRHSVTASVVRRVETADDDRYGSGVITKRGDRARPVAGDLLIHLETNSPLHCD
jgi:hypothetical protein